MPDTDKKEKITYYEDPRTGQVQKVREDMRADFEESGYVPLNLSDTIRLKREEALGGLTGQLGTGLLSGLSGATFGLSDVALTKADIIQSSELKETREINPGAAIAGEIVGGLASMAGGPLGLLAKGTAKLGAKAGAKVASGLGRTPGGAVEKIADVAINEAALGSVIGAGQALSKAAERGDDIITKETGLAALASAGTGALFSGGLGVAGLGARTVGSKLKDKLSFTKRLKELNGEKKVLIAELDEARTVGDLDRVATLEQKMNTLQPLIGARQSELVKNIFVYSAGAGTAMYLAGENAGALAAVGGFLAAPSAAKLIEKGLTPISGMIPKGFMSKLIPKKKPPRNPETLLHKDGKYAYGLVDVAEEGLAEVAGLGKDIAKYSKTLTKAKSGGRGVIKKRITERGSASEEFARMPAMADDFSKLINQHKNRVYSVKKTLDKHIRWPLKKAANDGGEKFSQAMSNFQKNKKDYIGHLQESKSKMLERASAMRKIADEAESRMNKMAGETGMLARGVQDEYRMMNVMGNLVADRTEAVAHRLIPRVDAALKSAIPETAGAPTLLDKLKTIPLDKIQNAVTEKIVPGFKAGATAVVTDKALESMLRETEGLDRDQLALDIAAKLPNASDEFVGSISDRIGASAEYARQQLPSEDEKNEIKRKQALSKIRAIVEPESFLKSFANGTLSPAQRDAWSVAYPEALAALQAAVRVEVEQAKVRGDKYSTKRKNQIGILLDDQKMYDHKKIRAMQEVHRQRDEEKQKIKGGSISISKNYGTTMQRLQGRK